MSQGRLREMKRNIDEPYRENSKVKAERRINRRGLLNSLAVAIGVGSVPQITFASTDGDPNGRHRFIETHIVYDPLPPFEYVYDCGISAYQINPETSVVEFNRLVSEDIIENLKGDSRAIIADQLFGLSRGTGSLIGPSQTEVLRGEDGSSVALSKPQANPHLEIVSVEEDIITMIIDNHKFHASPGEVAVGKGEYVTVRGRPPISESKQSREYQRGRESGETQKVKAPAKPISAETRPKVFVRDLGMVEIKQVIEQGVSANDKF